MIAFGVESPADFAEREQLLDRAMGAGRRRKSSERLRQGRLPAEGLALAAHDDGHLVGTVRLWHVAAGRRPALLLGPLAVASEWQGEGIGSRLMQMAIDRARALGHCAILLVGDAPYYARFGFSAEVTAGLSMPGPFERHRFLGLELVPGALSGARGVLKPTGEKVLQPVRQAA